MKYYSNRIKQMSRRRQKIAIRKAIEKDLMPFIGRLYDHTLYRDIQEQLMDGFAQCVFTVKFDDMKDSIKVRI